MSLSNITDVSGPIPFICNPSYDPLIEISKYVAQCTFLIANVILNFAVLKATVCRSKGNSFYTLYAADLIVGIYMALSEIFIDRLFIYITPLCPIISSFFFEPSIFLKFSFTMTHYSTCFKTISQVFLSLNRMSCVIFPTAHEAIWKKTVTPCLILMFLLPFGKIWNILISRVYANPSGGGFSANYIKAVAWASVSRLHLGYFIVSLFFIILFSTIALYYLIFLKIRLKLAERSITLATFIISIEFVILAVFQIYFAFFSSLDSPLRPYLIKALEFTYDTLNFFPPIVMVILNKQLRMDMGIKWRSDNDNHSVAASRTVSNAFPVNVH